MAQHFLLSPAARSLSLASVAGFTEDEAWEEFKRIRWPDTNGEPVCPYQGCGCTAIYRYKTRRIFKCKACERQFSVTSGTIFASHKLPLRVYLYVVVMFACTAKGISAVQVSRYVGVNYKTAFELLHKVREAMGADVRAQKLSGVVEVDGVAFGGAVKVKNLKEKRTDQRIKQNQTGRRLWLTVARARNGRTVPFVCRHESHAIQKIRECVAKGSVIHVDSATHWTTLDAYYKTKRVNHQVSFAAKGACTNWVEGASIREAAAASMASIIRSPRQHSSFERMVRNGHGEKTIGAWTAESCAESCSACASNIRYHGTGRATRRDAPPNGHS
jgi:transposase-like protein